MILSMKEQEIADIQQTNMQKKDAHTLKHAEFEKEMDETNPENTTSDCGALLHIVKSSLGGGVLAMPYAFKNAGLAFGVVAAFFIGIIVTQTMVSLINCSQNLCKVFNKRHMSYADTAEYAFLHGHKGRWKKQAYLARIMVNLLLFITYYGVLTYYVLMISSTMKDIVDKYANIDLDLRLYTMSVALLVFPVGIIKLLKYLVPFSALANIFLFIALGLIFKDALQDLPPMDSRPAVQPVIKWPIFFATSFTSMEGIGTILPLENEMRNPHHLTHSYRLLYIGQVFCVALNIVVGFLGYLKYGNKVKGVISLNLPTDWLSEAVKITIALVILFTYGLQMTAPMKVIWDGVKPYTKHNKKFYYYLLRALLIVGNVSIATALPFLGGLIGLLGSLGFALLGIFFPALIELICLSTEDFGIFKWRLVKNLLLILFSVVCAIAGVYSSILDMMNE